MRKAILFVALSLFVNLLAQNKNQNYLNYIQEYSSIALKQQNEYGVPASIILAQGLLESGAGQGTLAKKSNNHFGIKCGDWKGEKAYHDDDAKNECFRKYETVLESFNDHSLFLKNRSRYASLFQLKSTDYEAWAHGLKKAGYATDPAYAYKLISIVESYDLHKIDLSIIETPIEADTQNLYENLQPIGKIDSYNYHKVLKNNYMQYVLTVKGDTYSSIADEFDIDEAKLKMFNEVEENDMLTENTIVYLQYKKSKASRRNPTHIVQLGETMHYISQIYGVKIQKLYILNNMSFDKGAMLDQVIKLR